MNLVDKENPVEFGVVEPETILICRIPQPS
jgi:hypothetical protein